MSTPRPQPALELLVTYTIFPDVEPKEKEEHADVRWSELADRVRKPTTTYLQKEFCPLISLGEYGDELTPAGCIRSQANLRRVFGIEVDYDDEKMSLRDAERRLQAANLCGVLYTTARHAPERPRWRGMFPLSEPTDPKNRAQYVARINRVLGGALADESFRLSQSFYIGQVRGVQYETAVTTGRCVDLAVDIEPLYLTGRSDEADFDPTPDDELRQAFPQGSGRYTAMLKLSSRWAARGRPADDIEADLLALLATSPKGNRRTAKHRKAVAELARSAVAKWGETRRVDRQVAPGVDDADDSEFTDADPRIVEDLKALPKNVLPLPNDYVPFTVAAKIIFTRLAEDRELFVRAGRVVEVGAGQSLDILSADALRSRLEKSRRRLKWAVAVKDQLLLKLRRCSKDTAEVLLESLEARQYLPPIALVTRSAVLVEQDGKLRILGGGYYDHEGGIMVFADREPPRVPIETAVPVLLGLLNDFQFATPGDRSRAAANFIGPGLRMGRLLPGHALVNAVEANESQTGKGYLIACQREVYGEPGINISKRDGGVGSLDESIASAVFHGSPFVTVENLRGAVASQYFEALLTIHGLAPVRLPHRGEVHVDISRTTFHLTSNGFEATVDLGNRSLITRLLHQPKGYRFQAYPEGALLEHIKARQSYFLGCVFAVVERWHAEGKPRLPTDHSFIEWVGALDWIVQKVFKLPPLLEGHEQAVQRVTSPGLSWLRLVAQAVARDARLGEELTAMTLVEICGAEIEIPGAAAEATDMRKARQVGILMAKIFKDNDECQLDVHVVRRIVRNEYVCEHLEPVKRYVFSGPARDNQLEGM